jgi:predicted RNA-binding Zn-ribbon protein involved in translation (DUF1610 family)
MGAPGRCANCAAPLPQDQPAGHHYCAKCAAAWQGGDAREDQRGPVEDDLTRTDSGQCANCGAALPQDQPAGHHYCAKCAAAWQRGNAARQNSAL